MQATTGGAGPVAVANINNLDLTITNNTTNLHGLPNIMIFAL